MDERYAPRDDRKILWTAETLAALECGETPRLTGSVSPVLSTPPLFPEGD